MSAAPEDTFDFLNPDYAAIFRERARRLARIRSNPHQLPALKAYYREHIADFISQWGVTYNPKNVAARMPAYLPFVLQPKQYELVDWIIARWRAGEPGLIEKSRDVGCSWIAMCVACALCIFERDMSIGFGSASEVKLDRSGDPDSLFYKGRMFVENLPREFRAGCDVEHDAPFMRILFPDMGSSITGEVGDNIGRGGRKGIYFVDEAAYIVHPQLMESALSGNTDSRIDISSVSLNGMANAFSIRRHSGTVLVFTLHYRDDLRKTPEWVEKKKASTDPVVWAADYEINYTAAAEGVIIPQLWVRAAIDAHVKLGIEPTGVRAGALDVADEGPDLNAFAARHGMLITHSEDWSGKNSDVFVTADRAFMLCDEQRLESFQYDADGMGAGIRAAANRITERRLKDGQKRIRVVPFKGSSGVFEPESFAPGTEVKNKDRFYNLKAQAWFGVRDLFWHTFRAVNGEDHDKDRLISLSSKIKDLQKLCIELSQAQWKTSTNGKIVVEKTPDGARSPNRADALVILLSPSRKPMRISNAAFDVHEEY